jgi:hypothetical protein
MFDRTCCHYEENEIYYNSDSKIIIWNLYYLHQGH